jgi:hypothetical protein
VLDGRSHHSRVTPASQMVLPRPTHVSRPASDAVLMQRGQEDQRMYRALHTLETYTIAALNNYPHRPRRTRNTQSQRVPFARRSALPTRAEESQKRSDSFRVANHPESDQTSQYKRVSRY